MQKDIIKIKKTGNLIAFIDGRQYWLNGNILYSIRSDGENFNVWCGIENLPQHLHRLYQITGKKYFTENKDMTIINKNFIKRFAYA